MDDELERKRIVLCPESMSISSYMLSKHKMYTSETFYHYTDISGFLGIINESEFWFSNIKFLNDREEFVEGKKKSCDVICEKMKCVTNDKERDFLSQLLSVLDKNITNSIFPVPSVDVFSLSFSHARDSLDMWRGYGVNGGIALGFEKNIYSIKEGEEFAPFLVLDNPDDIEHKFEFYFAPREVTYDDELKYKIISEVVNCGLEYVNSTPDYIKSDVEEFAGALFRLFPFFKNRAFHNEQECRMIDNFNGPYNPLPQKIYYRERKGVILPYIKYKALDKSHNPISKWPISEIIVGPGNKQNDLANSIKYFLRQKGMDELADKIVLSNVPYAT